MFLYPSYLDASELTLPLLIKTLALARKDPLVPRLDGFEAALFEDQVLDEPNICLLSDQCWPYAEEFSIIKDF